MGRLIISKQIIMTWIDLDWPGSCWEWEISTWNLLKSLELDSSTAPWRNQPTCKQGHHGPVGDAHTVVQLVARLQPCKHETWWMCECYEQAYNRTVTNLSWYNMKQSNIFKYMQSRILKESKYNHERESHQGVIHETFQRNPAVLRPSS